MPLAFPLGRSEGKGLRLALFGEYQTYVWALLIQSTQQCTYYCRQYINQFL